MQQHMYIRVPILPRFDYLVAGPMLPVKVTCMTPLTRDHQIIRLIISASPNRRHMMNLQFLTGWVVDKTNLTPPVVTVEDLAAHGG